MKRPKIQTFRPLHTTQSGGPGVATPRPQSSIEVINDRIAMAAQNANELYQRINMMGDHLHGPSPAQDIDKPNSPSTTQSNLTMLEDSLLRIGIAISRIDNL